MDHGPSSDLVNDLPVVQRLALAYAPHSSRSGFAALFALDARLAQIVRARREVVLAQMRLAWWRDMLGKPSKDWPKGDVVLGVLREWVRPEELVRLVDGWEALLSESLRPREIGTFAKGRAAALKALTAHHAIEVDDRQVESAAHYWALGDLAANVGDAQEREAVLQVASNLPGTIDLPRQLRPLRVLSGLARRALAKGGTPLMSGPADVGLAIRLGMFGR